MQWLEASGQAQTDCGSNPGKVYHQTKNSQMQTRENHAQWKSLKGFENPWKYLKSLKVLGLIIQLRMLFLASQDALEVMLFTYLLTHSLMVSNDFTDVTLVGDDT